MGSCVISQLCVSLIASSSAVRAVCRVGECKWSERDDDDDDDDEDDEEEEDEGWFEFFAVGC